MSTIQARSLLPHEMRQMDQSKSLPGMIHFDVSQGCTAELLNGALLDLGLPLDGVHLAFKQLGISHLIPTHCSEGTGRCLGSYLDLVNDSGQSFMSKSVIFSKKKSNGRKQSPHWDHKAVDSLNEIPAPTFKTEEQTEEQTEEEIGTEFNQSTENINRWLRQEPGTIDNLISHVQQSKLSPIPSALVQKTLGLLAFSLKRAHGNQNGIINLDGNQLIRILCQVVAFCVLLNDLDPFEVSATRIPLAWPPNNIISGFGDLDEKGWTLALVELIPTYEKEWPAPFAEPVGAALLKTIVRNFGARGESHLLQSGVGVQRNFKECNLLTRALWCEPVVIATRSVEGPSSSPKVSPLLYVKCLLGGRVDVQDLSRRMQILGAENIITAQVMEQGVRPKTSLSLISSHREIERIIEALLITGEAVEVTTGLVERYELLSRKVSIPFGRKQKTMECGVTEWLMGNKILRAEPVHADLMSIVSATGFSPESVRSDVLAAWKKWRREE